MLWPYTEGRCSLQDPGSAHGAQTPGTTLAASEVKLISQVALVFRQTMRLQFSMYSRAPLTSKVLTNIWDVERRHLNA